MQRLWATLMLLALTLDPDQIFAASPAGATDAPEDTVPQGTDPPGADNGDQPSSPLLQHKGVIEPLRSVMRTFTRKPLTLRPDMMRK